MDLKELISRFLSSRRGLSPRTMDYYQCCLAGLRWFARSQGWPPVKEVTRDHLRDFLDYVATEPVRWQERRPTFKTASPATVHHYGTVLKTLFNWAEAEEYVPANPGLRLRLAPPHYKEVLPYSDEEVKTMLQLCQEDAERHYRYLGVRNRAIISVFTDTGLRLEELWGMRLSNLDPHLRQLRVMGKGSKLRVVPVDGEAGKALRQYLKLRPQGGDRVWKTEDGVPLQLHSLKIMIARLKRRAGIPGSGGAHRFRHYFATRYLENGGNINSLRLLLGHATLCMVLRYSRYVDVRSALNNHRQFSPLDHLYNGDKTDDDDGWGWKG